MTPPPSLTGAHRRTYETIFQHPVSHNLGWHEVHALLRELGACALEPNGNFKAVRHGATLVLPPARTKDVGTTDEVMKLRAFLATAAPTVAAADSAVPTWLVVINHHEARIFQSLAHGTAPVQVRPQQSDDAISHVHGFDGFSRGQEKPAPQTYFGPVAAALEDAPGIILFGSGTGSANEMVQLVTWLGVHHPAIGQRIVGTHVIDEHHLTDDQLLATAREFRAAPRQRHVADVRTHPPRFPAPTGALP